jgi:two-component system phosphate regulon sensor histidine kinase PhoR
MAKSLRLQMEELVSEQQRIAATVEAMSAGVVVFDRNARAVLANRWIRRTLDIQGDVAGRSPMEIARHPAVETAVRKALEGAEVPAFDLPTGAGRILSAKAARVGQRAGQGNLAVVVFHDLTEIRRAEKIRKDFVANVSHEVKTPLTSIGGYAETLRSAPPRDPEVAREFLAAIERNTRLLSALVEDLLVLAQLEGELPVRMQGVDVLALVRHQVASRQHLIESRGIQIEVDCPERQIWADPARLARALANLLDNAVHYNRPEGRIRVSGTETPGGFAIAVSDTGYGIPADDLPRIFGRFYRVEKSRAREGGGTGLGLAIAKHAIESQGGSISASSTLGAGSTFIIVLPDRNEPAVLRP